MMAGLGDRASQLAKGGTYVNEQAEYWRARALHNQMIIGAMGGMASLGSKEQEIQWANIIYRLSKTSYQADTALTLRMAKLELDSKPDRPKETLQALFPLLGEEEIDKLILEQQECTTDET